MPFAPHEIEQKRFVTTLRGYHPDEVDGFLRAVAADYRAALEQADATTPVREAAVLIQIAEERAEAILERARREAAEIVDLARLEAELALQEIDRRAERLGQFERSLLYGSGPARVAVETNAGDATAAR